MNELHLKQGFRLNRAVAAAAMFYLVVGLFQVPVDWQHILGPVLFGVALLAVIALVVGNELVYASVQRFRKLDPVLADKMGLVLPMVMQGGLVAVYLATGQAGLLLLQAFGVMLAQLFGHRRLAWTLTLVSLLVALATMPLGYPRSIGLASAFGHAMPWAVAVAILAPFVLTLFFYNSLSAYLVNHTMDRASKLQSLAATDGLTGLINRRQFNHQLHSEIARARRANTPLTLALFDIDDFKKLNDFYGHPMGDRILKELCALVKGNVRESDIPARYGGEEFALILPETRQLEAYDILERLRAMIEQTVFCLPDNPITLSVSVGLVQMDPERMTAFELVEQADACLYEAKNQGKNRVVYGVVPTPKLDYIQGRPVA
ncbi:MAG: GGDEF domain-containing protein [Candidatus Melainabacteria bacterium]